jgi:hypothetical protein
MLFKREFRGGHGHNVVRIGNVDLQFTNGDVKNIP